MVQCMDIHICNTLCEQSKDDNHMIISLHAEKKNTGQKTTPIHVKSIGEIRNSSFIPNYKKSNIQQTNSQHQTKLKKNSKQSH